MSDIDPDEHRVQFADGARVHYDRLVLATGTRHSYFGHGEWEQYAPGLKTVEDAIEIRRRLLLAFERAERTDDADERRAQLTFVVVGGGPTGVETAGAIAEIAFRTLTKEFRSIDPSSAQVIRLFGFQGGAVEDLPEGISGLAFRNSWELSERRFADDVAALAKHLRTQLPDRSACERSVRPAVCAH